METEENRVWTSLLMDVIRSPEGARRLPNQYWELLVEFAVSEPWWPQFGDTDALKITRSLIDVQEWGKLECWIGIAWMFSRSVWSSSSELTWITKEDFENSTLLLLRKRPGAAQRFEQWMEQWSKQHSSDGRTGFQTMLTQRSEALQRILTQAHEAVQRPDTL